MNPERINCFQCNHFYITWDKNFPHGCRVFGFKTRQLPSVSVKQASGADCAAFQPKPSISKSE
ncbi:MAG: uracil-DNA glycosylase [Firmicutes bacterium]|nr:uracil-DNA glycosylase [Bacillota bacterium]